MENIQLSLFGRMYPELFQVTTERILEPCLKKSQTPIFQCLQVANGQPQEWLEGERLTPLGESLMLNIGEYPSVENESTLSEILEDNVPEKYYLSPKACLGILRRAKNKGRKLPDNLRIALEQKVAEGGEVLGLDFAHADSVVRTYKDITPTLVQNMGRGGGQTPCIMYEQRTIAIDQGGGKSQCGITTELSPTLTCTHGGGSETLITESTKTKGNIPSTPKKSIKDLLKKATQKVVYIIRRLTPVEGERLQGYPDDWTKYGADGNIIAYTARYRAIGNSICVYCAERLYIGIIRILQEEEKDNERKDESLL